MVNETEKKIMLNQMKKELWARFGSAEYPAEWDGNTYGGGKLSQRYWEYFIALDMLELSPDSVVLDIGGGSPETGIGFFTKLISGFVKKVIIIDPNIKNSEPASPKVEFIKEFASENVLKDFFRRDNSVTHVVSISVLEHIESELRRGIMRAINECFQGDIFAVTFEYHSRRRYFEYQLTPKTTAEVFKEFTRFYPARFEAAPISCENSFVGNRVENWRIRTWVDRFLGKEIPGWYPVALQFRKF